MADTYVDLISKLQQQGLNALKQAQEAHLAALSTARDIATQLATTPIPTPDTIPSVSKLTELSSDFATQLLEQQKAYADKLATFFDATRKDVTEQVGRFTKQPTNAQ